MALTKRDRNNVTVDSLIGYAKSAHCAIGCGKDAHTRWADGLVELADALSRKLDQQPRESSDITA